MPVYFLDSSALAKRYMVETGTAWITTLTEAASGNECWLATITAVELVAALYRKARTGSHPLAAAQQAEAQFRSELATHFRRLAATSVILDGAMGLAAAHPLRAYDAVQLASALRLQRRRAARGWPALTFVSADQNLNRVAAAKGLSVDDPKQHP